MISDDKLRAYAEGGLDPAEAEEVEAALFAEPALAERLETLRAEARKRRRAPAIRFTWKADRLVGALGALGAAIGRLLAPLGAAPPAFVRWALLAACLAGGVVAGRLSAQPALIVAEAGALRAGPMLARALSERLADSPRNASGELRIGVSLRSLDGRYCRTFAYGGQGAISGLACREEGRWLVLVAAAGQPPQTYFIQGRLEAPIVFTMLDEIIVGEPLDAQQERAARAAGWGD